jgi:pimeloyl-ACP methyl ester carboxylesterase
MALTETRANAALFELEAQIFALYALQPQTRLLRLAGPPVGLRAVELGSGPPALFMHGISLCTAHWAPLMAHLDSLHRVAIDMPGHGGSDGADYSGVDLRRWHTDMLTACLDELELDSAHLVGHSYGGMLALWLALDAPKRVRSVVAVGTPAVAFGARPDPTLRMLALRGLGPLALAMPNPLFVYRRILAMSLGANAIDAAPPELVRATYMGTRRPGFARTVSTYLREQFRGARSDPQRYVLQDQELTQIQQPVLVVWGEHDDRYQPVAEARRQAALIPNARFELVPGGHEPWLDDPDACARPIRAFVAANAGAHHRTDAPPT